MHVIDHSLKIAGRADIIFNDGTETRILELKRTDPMWDGSVKPAFWHLLQCMSYHLITGLPVSILLMTRYAVEVFDLVEMQDHYFFTDSDGFKIGVTLTVKDFMDRLDRSRSYMTGEVTKDPMPDFLNQEGGWECYHRNTKKMNKKGTISPRCPWWCREPQFDYQQKEDGTYEIVPKF